jgi:hypothetical protein
LLRFDLGVSRDSLDFWLTVVGSNAFPALWIAIRSTMGCFFVGTAVGVCTCELCFFFIAMFELDNAPGDLGAPKKAGC